MRRHIPGLHSGDKSESNLDGLFLVRVERASYRWHEQKPFLDLQFVVLEPASNLDPSLDACTAPAGRSGNSIGSFAILATTQNCSIGTKLMKKLCWVCVASFAPRIPL